MLEQLLKYHQNLLSQDFVKAVLKRVEKAYQTRTAILGCSSILGMAVVLLALNSLTDTGWLKSLTDFFNQPQYLIYSALTVLIAFIAGTQWFFNDSEFN